jgi:hypothetical protein
VIVRAARHLAADGIVPLATGMAAIASLLIDLGCDRRHVEQAFSEVLAANGEVA